jgi:hypothetical protein
MENCELFTIGEAQFISIFSLATEQGVNHTIVVTPKFPVEV